MKLNRLYEKFQKKLYKPHKPLNFRDLVYHSARTYPSRPAFQLRDGRDAYTFVTYAELKTRYLRVGNLFLDHGLQGKKIAFIGPNSSEWVLCYLAAATVGVAVPLDKELHPEDLRDFLQSADCAAVVTDGPTAEVLQKAGGLELLYFTWDEVRREAVSGSADSARIDALAIPEDQMQVLIFTSGTSGKSKGVCLSQKNICADLYATTQMVKITDQDRTLSILPLHHTYECTLNCLLLLSRGACITYADSLTKIAQNMAEYGPSVLVVVPALLQVLGGRIHKSVAKKLPQRYRALFSSQPLAQAMQKAPFWIRMAIRQKVRDQLGGNLRLIIVGGADLNPAVVEDFLALGIRTLQGYGLTECAPLIVGNNDFYLNPQSTGLPIPGVTIRIDNPNEDGIGEILASGDNVMLGYYQDEEANQKAFVDGFFRTGDLGRFDESGYLYITGRKKNVIVTGNGKNIYPEELEARLSTYDIIRESLVLAAKDRKDEICVKAKILPNTERISAMLGHLPSREEMDSAIAAAIAELNEKLPAYKHIRVIEVLLEELEKTTTRKIRRCGRICRNCTGETAKKPIEE